MAMQCNLHPREDKKLTATSVDYGNDVDSPFVTFEMNSGTDRVIVFLRKSEDAKALIDAAFVAYYNLTAMELRQQVEAATKAAAETTTDNWYKTAREEANTWYDDIVECTITDPCRECQVDNEPL